MSSAARRLSARIDAVLARKVEALQSETNASATDVVRAALNLYYAKVMSEADPAVLLRASGFIGCADGPVDSSRDVKRHYSTALGRKRR